jgi:hypothetical protein
MYEVCNTKNMFENEFQKYYFYVVFFPIIKSYFLKKTLILDLLYASKALFTNL